MTISSDPHPDELPPPGWKRVYEAASIFSRIHRSFGHLGPRGPEGGDPAMVIPGFIATDRTTMQLRRALGDAGFRVHPWGLGLNKGATEDVLDRIDDRVSKVVPDGKLLMIGWSLGGLFAREYARYRPEKVRAVVTLGSPISGDPRANNVWKLYEWVAGHPVDNPPIPRITEKPPVPHLALWSRRDGIVAPRAARGLPEECDESCEIDCSHMGFGVSKRAVGEVVREIDSFLKK